MHAYLEITCHLFVATEGNSTVEASALTGPEEVTIVEDDADMAVEDTIVTVEDENDADVAVEDTIVEDDSNEADNNMVADVKTNFEVTEQDEKESGDELRK